MLTCILLPQTNICIPGVCRLNRHYAYRPYQRLDVVQWAGTGVIDIVPGPIPIPLPLPAPT